MDYSHMEKMGRELKCPICLSLLNSAVSLSCNHVFCNLCIGKSMKSTSDCPVCKVPFRRREVRPAQHMDNLVSIYKSMEAASAVSVFVSQTVSSQKLSGRKNQPEGYIFCDNGNDLSRTPDPGNKGNLKGNSSKGSSKKPSFPAKKRVQVPQHPLPETPVQPPAKDKVSLRKHTKTESPSKLAVQKDMPIFKNKENLEFRPFFWLRDEDAEKSSQPSDEDHVMDTPPVIPCFSDIKDSDDELQCDKTPEKGLSIASHIAADLFDSEIFEWTQRACSPELCSSPLKVQVEGPDRCNVAMEEDKGGSESTDRSMEPLHSKECFVSEKGTDKMVVDLVASACPETVYICNEGKTARCNKRFKKASNNSRNKRPKRSNRICIDSMDVTKDKNSDGEVDSIIPGNVPILKGISVSTVKNVTVDSIDTQITIDKDSTLSGCEISLNHSTKPMLVDLAVPVDFTCGIRKGQNMKKSSKGHQNKRERETKAICTDPKDESEKNFQNVGLDQGNASNISNLKVRSNKSVGKVCLVPSVTQSMPGYVSPCAEVAKAHNQDVSPMLVVDLSGSFNDGEGYRDEQNVNSTKKNNTIVGQQRSSYSRRSKPQQLTNSANTEMQNLGYNGFISDSSKFFPIGCDLKVSDLGLNGTNKGIEEILNSSGGKNLKPAKKVTFFAGDNSKGLSANSDIYDSAKESQLSINAQGDSVDSLKREKTSANLNGILRKCETNPMKFQCLFCQCKEDSEASGFMVHFLKGKPVTVGYGGSNILHAHSNCTEWAPNVYFEGDIAINLEAELTRSKRIKCNCCGLKGAALGCYEKSCHRSFHVPCAKLTPQCRWDYENFVMLCPLHASSNLPCEISGSQRNQKAKCRRRRHTPQKVTVKHDRISSCNWNSHGLSRKIVLCCSALTVAEKATVTEFESLSKVTVLKNWDSSVTHVIASTDENGACRRTLKFLMGILEGKWILSIEWVKACLKAMENVDEQHYEISVDIHGIRDGPRNGRLRLLNKQPKLLDGYKFYFSGDFLPSYKGYLNDLVVAAGGKVLHRKPIFEDNEAPSSTYIIYSLELPDKFKSSNRTLIFDHRLADAEAIASSCQGIVGTNSWLLNSIAACKLQKLGG